jgi:hypothetical protein
MPVGMAHVPAANSGSEPHSLERCAPAAILESSRTRSRGAHMPSLPMMARMRTREKFHRTNFLQHMILKWLNHLVLKQKRKPKTRIKKIPCKFPTLQKCKNARQR